MISIIVAIAAENAIGKDQDLLCYLPADLKHFKELTTGHTIVMGRRTFESLPKGALPNRTNIVLTRRAESTFPGTEVFPSLEKALDFAKQDPEIFIIGGASVYEEALALADRMYLTFIHHTFAGADTFFPTWNENEWREIDREDFKADEKNKFDYSFVTLERI
ncbi:MAG: dihydrofolate reductase [Bacteroidales bacterium]